MGYTIAEATFHTTVVDPNALRATLFCFDACRGFVSHAGVLGPAMATHLSKFETPQALLPRYWLPRSVSKEIQHF